MTDAWARDVEAAMRRRLWLAEQVAANERRIELLLLRIRPYGAHEKAPRDGAAL